MPLLMKTDPMVGKTATRWVQGADRPTDPAEQAHATKIRFPEVKAPVTVFSRLGKQRVAPRTTRIPLRQVAEVKLVEHHPVLFKSQPSGQFGIGRHFLVIHLAILYESENMFIQLIGGGDIPFIQSHMHVHGPVGYPSQPMQMKLLGRMRFGGLDHAVSLLAVPFADTCTRSIRSSVAGCVAKKPPPPAPSTRISHVSVVAMICLPSRPVSCRSSAPWRSAAYSASRS